MLINFFKSRISLSYYIITIYYVFFQFYHQMIEKTDIFYNFRLLNHLFFKFYLIFCYYNLGSTLILSNNIEFSYFILAKFCLKHSFSHCNSKNWKYKIFFIAFILKIFNNYQFLHILFSYNWYIPIFLFYLILAFFYFKKYQTFWFW